MRNVLMTIALVALVVLFVGTFFLAVIDTTAAHPTRFETIRGAGRVCVRMVEDRWFGTQIARYWECKVE